MGNCVNCIYHTTENQGYRLQFKEVPMDYMSQVKHSMLMRENHFCTYPSYRKTDFVTGKSIYASCYEKNFYEECLFYTDGTEEPSEEEPKTDEPVNTEPSADEQVNTEPTEPTEPPTEPSGEPQGDDNEQGND